MQTIKLLFRLCFFNGHIAKLPYSMFWLTFLLILNFILKLQPFMDSEVELPAGGYFFALVCSYLLLFGVIYLFLRMRKLEVRFVKMLIAYLGTETVLTTVIFSIVLFMAKLMEAPIFLIFFVLWGFALKAFIIKQSLDTQAAIGVMLAINIEVIRYIPFIIVFYNLLTQVQRVT